MFHSFFSLFVCASKGFFFFFLKGFYSGIRLHLRSRGDGATGTLGSAGLEAVLEPPGNVLQVAHAASAGGLSPLALVAPVVCWRWVST